MSVNLSGFPICVGFKRSLNACIYWGSNPWVPTPNPSIHTNSNTTQLGFCKWSQSLTQTTEEVIKLLDNLKIKQ